MYLLPSTAPTARTRKTMTSLSCCFSHVSALTIGVSMFLLRYTGTSIHDIVTCALVAVEASTATEQPGAIIKAPAISSLTKGGTAVVAVAEIEFAYRVLTITGVAPNVAAESAFATDAADPPMTPDCTVNGVVSTVAVACGLVTAAKEMTSI